MRKHGVRLNYLGTVPTLSLLYVGLYVFETFTELSRSVTLYGGEKFTGAGATRLASLPLRP
jgi:hypothetical protein